MLMLRGVPAGVLAVARSVLHQGDSSISAPLAELGLQPRFCCCGVATSAPRPAICCGLFCRPSRRRASNPYQRSPRSRLD